jgi:hypothetical protein
MRRTNTRRRIRQEIAIEAARLLTTGRETDYTSAKRKAARILGIRFRVDDFPSTREIREACRRWDELSESGRIDLDLRRMRLAALRWMRRLRGFEPRLVGPLVDGEVHSGAETAIDVEADRWEDVEAALTPVFRVVRLERTSPLAALDRLGVLLLEGSHDAKVSVFRLGQRPPGGWSINQLTDALGGSLDELEDELQGLSQQGDRFEVLADLLDGLERVTLTGEHPEGDAQYHALQLFDLVAREKPWDEELLTAALFHDVGRLSTGRDHLQQTLDLLKDVVTQRTLTLIVALNALDIDPQLSESGLATYVESDDIEDALLLARCDRRARQRGVAVSSIDEAIDTLRRLDSGDAT